MNLYTKVFPTITSGMVFGSLLGIIKNHIISKLPGNFIKNTYITNSIASISEEYYNEDNQLVKKTPLLSLGINMEYQPSDAEYIDVIRWGVKHVPKYTWLSPSVYTRFLVNEKDLVFVTALNSRLKVTMSAGIRVESEIQALNLISFIRNSIGIDRPYYLSEMPIEIPIPLELLDGVFVASKIDPNDPDWQKKFSAFVDKWSGGTMVIKKNLSTGNFVYFIKYKTNLLVKIDGMPSMQKNLEGKSVLNTDVTWNFEIDLPFFTNFISESLIEGQPDPIISFNSNPESVVYNYSFKNPLSKVYNDKDLFKLIEFLTEINIAVDKTDFSDYLSEDIKYYISNGNSALNERVEVLVWKDETLLVEGVDYGIDWDNFVLSLYDPLYNYVYRMALYVNTADFVKVIEAKKITNEKEIIEQGTL